MSLQYGYHRSWYHAIIMILIKSAVQGSTVYKVLLKILVIYVPTHKLNLISFSKPKTYSALEQPILFEVILSINS